MESEINFLASGLRHHHLNTLEELLSDYSRIKRALVGFYRIEFSDYEKPIKLLLNCREIISQEIS